MFRIPFLPRWVLPPTFPSLHDAESATAIEQTAKVYGAMQKMIEDYNNFTDQINKEIETFTSSSTEEINEFKKSIEQRLICKFNDMDARLHEIKAGIPVYADQKIADIYEQYLDAHMSQLINEKIAAGEIDITLVYDPETESLDITTGG
jgi:uncharacterized protein YdcH (DUF465 family)